MMNFYKICGNLNYNEVILLEFMGTLLAAKKWGIPRETFARYCREGKIKSAEHYKSGSPWRIRVDEPRPNYRGRKQKER